MVSFFLFVFFFFLKFHGSTVICPGQKWIWEELRIEEFFKPLSDHSSSHQWHCAPVACILLTLWVFPMIINHVPVASVSALPAPIYFYYYDYLPPSLLRAEVSWAHTTCQTHFKTITHVNLFGPLGSPQPFWYQGLVQWKIISPQMGSWGVGMVSGWFKHITYIMHLIFIIIISAPPQITKH